MKLLDHLVAVFGFLTIIPVGSSLPLEVVAEGMYLFPAVGLFLGFLGGLVTSLLMRLLPSLVSASLGFGFLLFLGGFNHLDGLADFGDGLMCVGDSARKIQAMRDTAVGAGGVGLVVLVVLASVGALSAYGSLGPLFALMLAECLAKHSMTTLAFLGGPAAGGTSTSFFRAMKGSGGYYRYSTSTVFALLFSYLFFGVKGLLVFLLAYFVCVLILLVSHKEFGGLTGDVFGATNELVRLAVLVALLVAP